MKICPNCGEELVLDPNYDSNGDIVSTLICYNANCDCDYSEHYSTTTKKEAEKLYLESITEDIDN